MEKLVYVLWKSSDAPRERFRDQLVADLGPTLSSLGARGVAMSVADEHVEYAKASIIQQMADPIAAIVSLWLDTHLRREPLEEAIGAAAARVAGYIVLESCPIANTTARAPLGERTPGINTIAFLEKPDRLSYDEWLAIWQGSHTQVAIETQSTFLYIQNVVIRALTPEAPAWVAIVEEAFPADAPRDQKVFYAAGDSDELLNQNRGRMIESCQRFIDFDRIESHMFSQYVLSEL